ncbi:MAG: tryptophan synthase subunit alpha [Armatimonadaceae bacterium]
MSRIASRIESLRHDGEKALVVFVTAGDPFPDGTADVVQAAAEGGADIVEIGIPFSDPLADGPVIQAASLRALQSGTTPPRVLDSVRQIRQRGIDIPLVLMGSWNPILQHGPQQFALDAVAAGADGTIVSDLSPEEAEDWKTCSDAAGLDTIFLLAPTSTPARMRRVGEMASGFVYCVSRTGITGVQNQVPVDLPPLVESIREHGRGLPVCVGFGVSTPDQVRSVCSFADGAVVGSALVARLHERKDLDDLRETVAALKAATRR